jgi:hypothetical protein
VWLQVEVKNTQKYNFDRGHSVWRRLLLPYGDLQLSVLTRLSLSGDHKVGHSTPSFVVPLTGFCSGSRQHLRVRKPSLVVLAAVARTHHATVLP